MNHNSDLINNEVIEYAIRRYFDSPNHYGTSARTSLSRIIDNYTSNTNTSSLSVSSQRIYNTLLAMREHYRKEYIIQMLVIKVKTMMKELIAI